MRYKLFFYFLLLFTTANSQEPPAIPGLLEKAEKGNDSLKATLYSQVGFLYLRQDKLDSSIYYGNLSLKAAEKAKDELAIADGYNNLGTIYRILSNHGKAMELYIKALKIYEEKQLYRKAARSLANISVVYAEQTKFELAHEKMLQAVEYSIKAKDTITLINLYESICDNHLKLNKLDISREYLSKANELLKTQLNKTWSSAAETGQFMQVKNYYLRLRTNLSAAEGKYEEAINAFLEDLAENRETAGPATKIYTYKELTRNYYKMNQLQNALAYSDSALSLLKTDSIADLYMQVYELRSKIFAGSNSFADAYKNHLLFKDISDSILNKDNFQTISDLQINYDTEKKEQQITTLNQKRKNQQLITGLLLGAFVIMIGLLVFIYRSKRLEQKLFRQKLSIQEQEREIETNKLEKKMNELEQMALRAQMNPHFIFNSLNAVQHFVMKQDVEGVNKYLAAFANLVRQTLNNSGRAFVSLDEEIKYLESYLSLEKMKSNNAFDYSIDVNENVQPSSTFIPGMILQPFVENSIKHGVSHKEKKDGHVVIHVSQNGRLVCEIEDNGIGRSGSAERKEAGEMATHESKGMKITMNRIETINKIYGVNISAKVEDLHDTAGNVSGTKVLLNFPTDLE